MGAKACRMLTCKSSKPSVQMYGAEEGGDVMFREEVKSFAQMAKADQKGHAQVGGHAEDFSKETPDRIVKSALDREVNFYEAKEWPPVFLPKYYGILEEVEGGKKKIGLEDVTHGYKRPCVMDLKIGTESVEHCDSFAKQIKMKVVDRLTGTAQDGVRVVGFSVYHPRGEASGWFKMNKKKAFMHSLMKGGDLLHYLAFYLSDGEWLRSEIIAAFLSSLEALAHYFERQTKYKFIGSSLLLVYDGTRSLKAAQKTAARLQSAVDRIKEMRKSQVNIDQVLEGGAVLQPAAEGVPASPPPPGSLPVAASAPIPIPTGPTPPPQVDDAAAATTQGRGPTGLAAAFSKTQPALPSGNTEGGKPTLPNRSKTWMRGGGGLVWAMKRKQLLQTVRETSCRLVMIDFAKTTRLPDEEGAIDTGYLTGVRAIIRDLQVLQEAVKLHGPQMTSWDIPSGQTFGDFCLSTVSEPRDAAATVRSAAVSGSPRTVTAAGGLAAAGTVSTPHARAGRAGAFGLTQCVEAIQRGVTEPQRLGAGAAGEEMARELAEDMAPDHATGGRKRVLQPSLTRL